MLAQHIGLPERPLPALHGSIEVDLTTIQILVLGEPLEKVVPSQRLVSGDGVTSSLNGGVGVFFEVLNVTSGGSVDIPGSPRPSRDGGTVQLSQAKLSLSSRDSGNIDITRVDEDVDIGPGADETLVEGDHALTGDVVLEGVARGANLPLASGGGLGVDGGLDILTVQVVDGQLVEGDRVSALEGEGPLEGTILREG